MFLWFNFHCHQVDYVNSLRAARDFSSRISSSLKVLFHASFVPRCSLASMIRNYLGKLSCMLEIDSCLFQICCHFVIRMLTYQNAYIPLEQRHNSALSMVLFYFILFYWNWAQNNMLSPILLKRKYTFNLKLQIFNQFLSNAVVSYWLKFSWWKFLN